MWSILTSGDNSLDAITGAAEMKNKARRISDNDANSTNELIDNIFMQCDGHSAFENCVAVSWVLITLYKSLGSDKGVLLEMINTMWDDKEEDNESKT
jgi:hypothetical protein